MNSESVIFKTERMIVSVPSPDDALRFMEIWRDPEIMKNVGFPSGISGLTKEKISEEIRDWNRKKIVFDRYLAVINRDDMTFMGECKLGSPEADRVSASDIKLLKPFQGLGYGTELKKSLIKYLFEHTEALAVSATPNCLNTASVRMQEKCGGRRLCECVYRFPDMMRFRHECVDLRYYLYMAYKKDMLATPALTGRHIIFDLDGTLLDTIGDIGWCVNRALKEFGFNTHSISAYRKMVGNGMRMTVKRALPDVPRDKITDDVLDLTNELYNENWREHTRVYPGVVKMLEKLCKSGNTLSIMTNKPHNTAVKCVEHYFGKGTFELIRGVKEDGLTKPSRVLVNHVMDTLGAKREETIFVGDSLTDMNTAEAARAQSLFVKWGYGNADDIDRCHVRSADSAEMAADLLSS